MNHKTFFILSFVLALMACKNEPQHLYKIEGKNITITDSLATDASIDAFIKPYREHVNQNLDSVLAYSKGTYSKSDGKLNTAIGNFMADMVYEQANPVFKKRTGHSIDFVLLNHGGIRAIISKGDITTRTAFEVMPFENSLVVADLKGAQVKELLDYLARNKRAHPIAGLKLVLDQDFNIAEASVHGTPIDFNKHYFVCTNDYLAGGGDRMNFFKTNDSLYVLDYKVRNAMIDYFKKVDTINPKIDDRFIQKK